MISVEVLNPSACDKITASNLDDVSVINPGKIVFNRHLSEVTHRGMNVVAGTLVVKMKVKKRAKRLLQLKINLYADKMRARQVEAAVRLTKNGVSVKLEEAQHLY